MKKNRKLIALALGMVMALTLLAACAPGTDGPPADLARPEDAIGAGEEGVIEIPTTDIAADAQFADHVTVIVDNNVLSVMNPFSPAAAGTSTNWVFTMVHDRLLNLDADGASFNPGLALTYETTDFQTFRLTLREGVTFHNGDAFTAADVVWTITAAQEYGLGSSAFDQWRPVQTVTAIDDFTVEIVLENVDVDFLFAMTRPMSGILNERAWRAHPDTGAHIGTGAFIIDEFISGDLVRMSRNHNWWNTDHGYEHITENVTLRFVPEMPTRTVMVQTGEAQFSFGTPPGDMDWFMDSPDFQVVTTTSNDPQGLAFNLANPITGDYYFRRAVLHALDREAIGFGAAGPWADGRMTDGTFWGYTTQFRNTNIPIIPRDLDLAREYLERSSYNGEPVTLTTAIMTNIMASQIIQAQLLEIGINIVLDETDSAGLGAFTMYGGTEHQMVMFFYLMTPNAGSVRHSFVPGGGQNRANFNNPEVTALLDEARVTVDLAQREQLYLRVQELVAEELAYTSIFWRRFGNVAANGFGGIRLNPDPASHDLRGVFYVVG
ncbi:MAG: ABC transporter substrate-binding protein [Oscillospiraceae bacterium]|nr:ABC transporter substrate-binding protein [Oscillospiraceae bacterium]